MASIIKHAFALGILLSSALAHSGDTFNDPNQPFEKVFDVPDHTRDQIFTSTKIWVAENFRSSKAVIEYESKEEGTLIGNGIIPYPCSGAFDCLGKPDWKVRFTMRVDMKDDKFRLTFSNVNLTWPASFRSGISTPAHDGPLHRQKDRDKVQAALLALGPQLQAAMTTAVKNNNW